MSQSILILGGYGMAGLPIARLLLGHTSTRLIVAGRRLEKAAETVAGLNADFPGGRAAGIRADAADVTSLATALQGVDLIVDCTPTTAHVETVTRAALQAGVDYLDILYGPNKLDVLLGLAEEAERAGRCFITEAGFHPGLPSALVRYAVSRLDRVDTAIVGGLLNIPIPYTEAVEDLVRELENFEAHEYKDGAWREASWSNLRKIDFGPPYGVRPCYAMDFYEMQALPERYGLQEAGFYMAGFNWFADWLIFMPWYMFKLGRFDWGAKLGARLLVWSTQKFIRPPHGVVLKLEATGQANGKPTRLDLFARHPDGYMFTAIPVTACLLQYLDGSIRKPGLWVMGQAVDAARLMRDMQRMGIEIEEQMAEQGRDAKPPGR
jgi:hypothetical protein